MVTDKISLIKALQDNRERILHFGVTRLGVFGSFVRNEMNDKSDVDFLVEFKTGKKTYKNYIHLLYLIENLTGRKIDLATEESLAERIKSKILKETENVFEA